MSTDNRDVEWLDEAAAAAWLHVSVPDLQDALGKGQLPGLFIGNSWRLSRAAVLEAARATHPVAPHVGKRRDPLPMPKGLVWITTDFKSLPAYSHRFGSGGTELYSTALAGEVVILGQRVEVVVATSAAPRKDGRRRRVVFFDGYPMYEFVESAPGSWAAVIRPDGRRYAAQAADLPPLYSTAPVKSYRDATGLTGRGRSTGLALVLADADTRSAVHHAAAKWLANRGHEVVAADV